MKKTYTSGFTLIELLVVIAIIGILSSVVLVSLNSARSKGNFAKVQSQLVQVRVAAENYYSTNGGYGTATAVCTAGMFTDSGSGMSTYTNNANYPTGTTIACGSSGTTYAVAATYTGTTPTSYVCVDSTGKSYSTTTAGAISGVASNATPACQ